MRTLIQALFCAVQFLTRLPIPAGVQRSTDHQSMALLFFPLVGWLLGLLLYVFWLMAVPAQACSPLVMAACIVAFESFLTGALHLDGLADAADAFLAPGRSREEKLAIMKDSRIGAMGAVALVLALLLKTLALSDLLQSGRQVPLMFYPAVGRWAQVALYCTSPYVRPQGVGSGFAASAGWQHLAGATLFIVPCCLLPGFMFSFLAMLAALAALRLYFHRQIGGITGDILGCATVVSEIVLLLSLLLLPL